MSYKLSHEALQILELTKTRSWEEVLQMDADQVHPWRCWLQNPDGHKDCPLGGGSVGIQQKQSQQVT